jgi:serine/threonine-protein kinase
VWVDRTGHEEPLAAPARAYQYLRISPDGTRIALDIRSRDQALWIWELASHTLTRLTFDPAQNRFPVWTPDGRRIVFMSVRAGVPNLFWQAADGTGTVDRLTESPNLQIPSSVSRHGDVLLLNDSDPRADTDLLLLPLTSSPRAPQPLIRTMAAEANGEISPDRRWLAYQSNESGREEIYVRPFPDVGAGRWQVSTAGGRTPVWAHTGDELFYRSSEGAVMTTRVGPGPAWRSSPSTQLVRAGYFGAAGSFSRTFDVSPDGRRFVMIKQADIDPASAPLIVVVQHWFEELKRLVRVN